MDSWTILKLMALVVLVCATGCGGPGNNDSPGMGLVTLRVVLAADTAGVTTCSAADIVGITVRVSGPEMEPLSVPLAWEPGSSEAAGHLEVPQGIDRLFEVEAVDSAGVALFAGQAVADIEAGAATVVTVDLWPTNGQVQVDVTIGNPAPGLGVLSGLCYGPFRDGQSPNTGVYPTQAEVAQDLALLAGRVERIRLYSSTHIHREIPRLAAEAGLGCWAQAWIGSDAAANEEEIQQLIAIGREGNAEALIVGSEVLLRQDMAPEELIALIERVRAAVPGVPVTSNDTCQVLIDNPELVAACDLVTANSYPYWETVPAQDAVAHVAREYERVCAAYPDKQVVIGETGWPSAGASNGVAVPDPVSQRRFLAGFAQWARSRGVQYLYFSAFDEAWKATGEGAVGAHWGLFNADRTMKTEIRRVWY